MSTSSSYEGKQDHIRQHQFPVIEGFENIYADREYDIHMETADFTCVCPKTGLPDFATLSISYCPGADCLELKSFKEYLLAFRNLGIFHENVVNRICDDIHNAIKPKRIEVKGIFNNRGGISTTVTSKRG